MKKIIGLIFGIFLATQGWAQGVRYQGIAFVQGSVVPNPNIRVCTEPATGQPCTPLANVFADPYLTQPLTQPFTGDAYGNFFFYAVRGLYHYEVSGSGVSTFVEPDVPLVSPSKEFNVLDFGALCTGPPVDDGPVLRATIAAAEAFGSGTIVSLVGCPDLGIMTVDPLNSTAGATITKGGLIFQGDSPARASTNPPIGSQIDCSLLTGSDCLQVKAGDTTHTTFKQIAVKSPSGSGGPLVTTCAYAIAPFYTPCAPVVGAATSTQAGIAVNGSQSSGFGAVTRYEGLIYLNAVGQTFVGPTVAVPSGTAPPGGLSGCSSNCSITITPPTAPPAGVVAYCTYDATHAANIESVNSFHNGAFPVPSDCSPIGSPFTFSTTGTYDAPPLADTTAYAAIRGFASIVKDSTLWTSNQTYAIASAANAVSGSTTYTFASCTPTTPPTPCVPAAASNGFAGQNFAVAGFSTESSSSANDGGPWLCSASTCIANSTCTFTLANPSGTAATKTAKAFGLSAGAGYVSEGCCSELDSNTIYGFAEGISQPGWNNGATPAKFDDNWLNGNAYGMVIGSGNLHVVNSILQGNWYGNLWDVTSTLTFDANHTEVWNIGTTGKFPAFNLLLGDANNPGIISSSYNGVNGRIDGNTVTCDGVWGATGTYVFEIQAALNLTFDNNSLANCTGGTSGGSGGSPTNEGIFDITGTATNLEAMGDTNGGGVGAGLVWFPNGTSGVCRTDLIVTATALSGCPLTNTGNLNVNTLYVGGVGVQAAVNNSFSATPAASTVTVPTTSVWMAAQTATAPITFTNLAIYVSSGSGTADAGIYLGSAGGTCHLLADVGSQTISTVNTDLATVQGTVTIPTGYYYVATTAATGSTLVLKGTLNPQLISYNAAQTGGTYASGSGALPATIPCPSASVTVGGTVPAIGAAPW